MVLVLEDGEEVRGDILLGCNRLYSVVRRLNVKPSRTEFYSGKAVTYGFVEVEEHG